MFAIVALALQAGAQVFSGIQANRMAGQQRRAANVMAQGVVDRAEFDVERYQRDLAQLQGQQVTGAAAQMLDVNQGSVAQIRAQTQAIGEQDIEQLRENARLEAWGIRRQGQIAARGLQNQATASFLSAGGTLLTNPLAQDAWGRFTGRRAANVVRRNLGTITADPSWF